MRNSDNAKPLTAEMKVAAFSAAHEDPRMSTACVLLL